MLVDQAAPEPPHAAAFSGGLVSPTADQPVGSAQDAATQAASTSPYATAFIDAVAPDMTVASNTAIADDVGQGEAIGEAVAAYSKNDDQPDSTSMNSNGHSSTRHRRNK